MTFDSLPLSLGRRGGGKQSQGFFVCGGLMWGVSYDDKVQGLSVATMPVYRE